MNSLCRHTLLLLLIIAFWPAHSDASPARPVFHTITLPDGRTVTYRMMGDESYHYLTDSLGNEITIDGLTRREQPRRRAAASRSGEGMATTGFPKSGSPRALVILAEYADVKFSIPDPADYFTAMLNLEGFDLNGATGSAADYFAACSGGRFRPQFDVYGPLTLPESQKYYGGNTPTNDAMAYKMIIHACDILADGGVDFSPYDTDGDGVIDNVYVIYAGNPESTGNLRDADTVWPHSWDVHEAGGGYPTYGGLLLRDYACSSEMFDRGIPDGIGSFCHEFSHVIGLPDLYSTGPSSAVTPGSWSCLDTGCYLNNARTPALYSAFERMSLGWLEPTPIRDEGNYTLTPLMTDNSAYIIATERDEEFFILENRLREGWDKYLPGEGMLVWHIDYDSHAWMQNAVNTQPEHQRVDLVEAVTRTTAMSRSSDPFPGKGNIDSFTAQSTLLTPAFLSWSGNDPGHPLTEIRKEGKDIRFHAGNSASGIKDTDFDAASPLITGGEAIFISGSDLPAEVYSVTGRQVYAGMSRRIDLPTGIYIVKIGNRTIKTAVTRP